MIDVLGVLIYRKNAVIVNKKEDRSFNLIKLQLHKRVSENFFGHAHTFTREVHDIAIRSERDECSGVDPV